jgi:hypothetical protein
MVLSVTIFHSNLFADYEVHSLVSKAFAKFFGKDVSDTDFRTVVNRFNKLKEAKQYANTFYPLNQPPATTFSFSCHDTGGCAPGVIAYVENPPQDNVLIFCPPFFTGSLSILMNMCMSPDYLPSNEKIQYYGAYMCSDYDASDTI